MKTIISILSVGKGSMTIISSSGVLTPKDHLQQTGRVFRERNGKISATKK